MTIGNYTKISPQGYLPNALRDSISPQPVWYSKTGLGGEIFQNLDGSGTVSGYPFGSQIEIGYDYYPTNEAAGWSDPNNFVAKVSYIPDGGDISDTRTGSVRFYVDISDATYQASGDVGVQSVPRQGGFKVGVDSGQITYVLRSHDNGYFDPATQTSGATSINYHALGGNRPDAHPDGTITGSSSNTAGYGTDPSYRDFIIDPGHDGGFSTLKYNDKVTWTDSSNNPQQMNITYKLRYLELMRKGVSIATFYPAGNPDRDST